MEQYTSWKVRVPDCVFFREKYEHRHVHIHIHIHKQIHVFIHVRVHMHVRVRVCPYVFLLCGAVSFRVPRIVGCWLLVGWVVGWLGVVCCY